MSQSLSPRVALMAGGQPISETIADQAAQWLTLLMSGEATDEDRRRLQQWRDAHADHERAWKHIEAVTRRLKVMEPKAAYKALSPFTELRSPGRRRALDLLMWGGGIGVACAVASRTQTWQAMTADYRTGVGEQRTVSLDDGTRLLLNTASAIDLRFDGQHRLLRLLEGEVMIVTGHPRVGDVADPRPFILQTDEGRIRALGTRFAVRQGGDRTIVAVQESAVEIAPDHATGLPLVLKAGERTTFTGRTIDPVSALAEQDLAWARGQIVADGVRLGDFLADLARYRPGIVRCQPAVADLRFSGVFPLRDTDRILEVLPTVLPVQVRQRTRYWVTVEARP